jgi:hypothetical protein
LETWSPQRIPARPVYLTFIFNGIEVLRRTKADERLHHIPVITITVVAEIEITILCPTESMPPWTLPATS